MNDSQFDGVASNSAEMFDIKEKFLDIDIGVIDYVLKCVYGPFYNKFVYINTSSIGETIGGATDYDTVANPHKVTMYIENVEMSEKHAQIIFNS